MKVVCGSTFMYVYGNMSRILAMHLQLSTFVQYIAYTIHIYNIYEKITKDGAEYNGK